MTKDLAYYRTLPYEREWLPRDDDSGRYFVVRLRDIPQIYGVGATRQEALTALRAAFDDQMAWCLDEGVEVPEPHVSPAPQVPAVTIEFERIMTSPAVDVRQSVKTTEVTRTAGTTESYRTSRPVDIGELLQVA
jgi:predicted RNase H-like HicB family nuclease